MAAGTLQAVAELLRRAGGGKTPETQPPATILPQLPAVTINDAIIRLVDMQGRQATVTPLSFKGTPEGTLVWNFDAEVPGQLHIKGEVAPGGAWQHKATVELANLLPLIQPFVNNPLPARLDTLGQFKLAGTWNGRINGNLTRPARSERTRSGGLQRHWPGGGLI